MGDPTVFLLETQLKQYNIFPILITFCLTLKMLVVELLNLLNVVGNIFFLDAFLGGEFSAYGIQVEYLSIPRLKMVIFPRLLEEYKVGLQLENKLLLTT